MSEEVTVTVEEEPPAEETPPVVIVEPPAEDTGHELVHAEHETRHVEHESRHDDMARLISEGFDRVESSIADLGNRVGNVETRLAQTEQAAESAEETAEEIAEVIEDNGNVETEGPPEETLTVQEPEPDTNLEPSQRSFLHRAWAGHGRY